MNNMILEEIKQVSAQIRSIENGSGRMGYKTGADEHTKLEQLSASREELISEVVFHGYC